MSTSGWESTRRPLTSLAGGVSSTVRDLAQWVRLELRNGVFNRESLIAPEALAATHVPLMTRGKNLWCALFLILRP